MSDETVGRVDRRTSVVFVPLTWLVAGLVVLAAAAVVYHDRTQDQIEQAKLAMDFAVGPAPVQMEFIGLVEEGSLPVEALAAVERDGTLNFDLDGEAP